MRTAAIYCRVSTKGQADAGTSLTTQIEACRQYAAQHGYTVVAEEAEDASGATLDRPGLDRLRDLAAQGHINALVIYALDRLSRDDTNTLVVVKELRGADVQLECVTQQFEDTPTGRFLLSILAAAAQLERATILERTRRGRERRVKEGNFLNLGGSVPYGYTFDAERRVLLVDEERAEWVRRIFEWIASEGISLRAVRVRLDSEGAPTPREDTPRWNHATIHRITKSRIYMGIWDYNKTVGGKVRRRRPRDQWVQAEAPAIVTPELFEKVQAQLKRNTIESMRSTQYPYLLRGLLTCALCGRNLVGGISGTSKGRYYACASRITPDLRGTVTCLSYHIRQQDFENAVWRAVVAQATSPLALERTRRQLKTQHPNLKTPQASDISRRRAQISAQAERLLDLYQNGLLSKDKWQARMDALGKQARQLDEQEAQQREAGGTRDMYAVERALAELQSPGILDWPYERKRALLIEHGVRIETDGVTALLHGPVGDYEFVVPRKRRPRRTR